MMMMKGTSKSGEEDAEHVLDGPPTHRRILLPPSERAPSAPVPSIVDENWAGVDMMYHLDGRRHRQSLVYFGELRDLAS